MYPLLCLLVVPKASSDNVFDNVKPGEGMTSVTTGSLTVAVD